MKIYSKAIISNLPNTILIDKITLDPKSKSIVVIPTEKPVLERADEDSNNASTKSLLVCALIKYSIVNEEQAVKTFKH